jgi:hypothetical protein
MNFNYDTCTQVANNNPIAVQTFFKLNPTVKPDYSNIQANTDYCVSECRFTAHLRIFDWYYATPNAREGSVRCSGAS